jgi:hypothetical protein
MAGANDWMVRMYDISRFPVCGNLGSAYCCISKRKSFNLEIVLLYTSVFTIVNKNRWCSF